MVSAAVAQYKGRSKTRAGFHPFIYSSPVREAVNITDNTPRDQQQCSTDWPDRAIHQPRHGFTLRRSTGRTFALDPTSLIYQDSKMIMAYLPKLYERLRLQ
jgi:hypothetical protein